ncbi:MAG: glycosyltransferase [Chloroflexota bacterium]
MSDPAAPLRLGILHLGPDGSGVRRYGRIVAGAARAAGIAVTEASVPANGGIRALAVAARAVAPCDVVEVQWQLADWGGVRRAVPRVAAFLLLCRRPLVVTLHDVYPRTGFADRWLAPAAICVRLLARRARALVVHDAEEERRLATFLRTDRVRVVPHFVETLPDLPARAAAKAELGLAGRRVVTLQGYMTRRKGHALVLEALRSLPDDVTAIFAGATIAGRDARADELRARAAELGVTDRVVFTGWVSDERLRTILAATDVALAPYQEMSASGSLSTWIASGRPIVASGLPQMRAYAALVPGALRIADPCTPATIAAAVGALLAEPPPDPDPAVARLADLLALPRIAVRYAQVWQGAAGR